MKIVHIAPKAIYNDYWGFHENLLPKYHRKLGHDVTLIVSNLSHIDKSVGKVECADYRLADGIRVIRRQFKKYPIRSLTSQNSWLEVFDLLVEIEPDYIFYHGLIGKTIYDVVKYKKKINPNCYIVEDNHLDYNIGAEYVPDKLSNILRRAYQKYINRKVIKYIDRVYGVTPWRVKYAQDIFGISEEKTDLLIMGADDDSLDFDNKESIRENLRKKHNISNRDFLIVTGGKIDTKKKIHLLMESVSSIDRVKLIIFGQVKDDISTVFNEILSKNPNIIYVGWVESDKVYEYFFAADLVFFPGQHSVLWEQACASRVPCIFERWEGMEHVDVGGNCIFIDNINTVNIESVIRSLVFSEKYKDMKKHAESDEMNVFLYSEISKKSLEIVGKLNKIM